MPWPMEVRSADQVVPPTTESEPNFVCTMTMVREWVA